MRNLSPHHSLGASLASVSILSGIVALTLGWVTPGTLPQITLSGPPPPVTGLAAPHAVQVSMLPAATR